MLILMVRLNLSTKAFYQVISPNHLFLIVNAFLQIDLTISVQVSNIKLLVLG